jgi:hypothetical protein
MLTTQTVEAEMTYYDEFNIAVTPEFPTTADEVLITISLDLRCTDFVETFHSMYLHENVFSTYVDIYVPQGLHIPMIKHAEHSFQEGMLPAGSYTVTVTVTVWGEGSDYHQYNKLLDIVSAHADVNDDGIVDVNDAYAVARAWGLKAGEPGYTLDVDINKDGRIGQRDLELLNMQYGMVS